MAQVAASEHGVPATQPHVVRRGVLAQARLGGSKGAVAGMADIRGRVANCLLFVGAPLVEQHLAALRGASKSQRHAGAAQPANAPDLHFAAQCRFDLRACNRLKHKRTCCKKETDGRQQQQRADSIERPLAHLSATA